MTWVRFDLVFSHFSRLTKPTLIQDPSLLPFSSGICSVVRPISSIPTTGSLRSLPALRSLVSPPLPSSTLQGRNCLTDGNTTNFTVEHYLGLESYTQNDLGVESKELAVYNTGYKYIEPFFTKGDSGSRLVCGRRRSPHCRTTPLWREQRRLDQRLCHLLHSRMVAPARN